MVQSGTDKKDKNKSELRAAQTDAISKAQLDFYNSTALTPARKLGTVFNNFHLNLGGHVMGSISGASLAAENIKNARRQTQQNTEFMRVHQIFQMQGALGADTPESAAPQNSLYHYAGMAAAAACYAFKNMPAAPGPGQRAPALQMTSGF